MLIAVFIKTVASDYAMYSFTKHQVENDKEANCQADQVKCNVLLSLLTFLLFFKKTLKWC